MFWYYISHFVWPMILAIILGGVLGWQRERIGKSAGPRTYALVSFGSAMFTLLSIYGFGSPDPSRVASQVVVGIGFLGAGMIMRKNDGNVEGLTTAAGLWAVAAIGMAVGVGWFWQSIAGTVLMLIVLAFNDDRLKIKLPGDRFRKHLDE